VTAASDLHAALWALSAYDTAALATISAEGPYVAGVYFAPEDDAGALELIIAVVRASRLHSRMVADPRVAFMCSPGNASRWIQGGGAAAVVADESRHPGLLARLVAHAPGSRTFIERDVVLPALIRVRRLTVVESPDRAPLQLSFPSSSKNPG
jgi:hypothetical protein